MEQLESQLLERLQHTQKKESEVFTHLTKAIKEALYSQKKRLETKQEMNERIRKDYQEPPRLSQWEELLRQQSVLPPRVPGARVSLGKIQSDILNQRRQLGESSPQYQSFASQSRTEKSQGSRLTPMRESIDNSIQQLEMIKSTLMMGPIPVLGTRKPITIEQSKQQKSEDNMNQQINAQS